MLVFLKYPPESSRHIPTFSSSPYNIIHHTRLSPLLCRQHVYNYLYNYLNLRSCDGSVFVRACVRVRVRACVRGACVVRACVRAGV